MFRPKSSTTRADRADRRPSRSRGPDPASDERDPPADAPRSGRITLLKPQQRDPERMNLFLDGTFAFGLHQDLVLEAGLAPGVDLDEELTASLLERDRVRQAIAAALNLLAYRPRAEGEIRTRLRQRGFPDGAIDETIDKLREWRYVDDQDFAERWIENRRERRPRSARMIAMELRGKGVEANTVSVAVNGAGIDERADALRIAIERWARLADLEAPVRVRRLTGFLSRRGYGFDVIRDVLKALEEDESEDDGV